MFCRPGFDSRQCKILYLLHSAQIDTGAHPAPYPMGTEGPFPGVERSGCEGDHLSPSTVEVKNGGAILPLPHTFSWRSI
jgi:hypothetical protein